MSADRPGAPVTDNPPPTPPPSQDKPAPQAQDFRADRERNDAVVRKPPMQRVPDADGSPTRAGGDRSREPGSSVASQDKSAPSRNQSDLEHNRAMMQRPPIQRGYDSGLAATRPDTPQTPSGRAADRTGDDAPTTSTQAKRPAYDARGDLEHSREAIRRPPMQRHEAPAATAQRPASTSHRADGAAQHTDTGTRTVTRNGAPPVVRTAHPAESSSTTSDAARDGTDGSKPKAFSQDKRAPQAADKRTDLEPNRADTTSLPTRRSDQDNTSRTARSNDASPVESTTQSDGSGTARSTENAVPSEGLDPSFGRRSDHSGSGPIQPDQSERAGLADHGNTTPGSDSIQAAAPGTRHDATGEFATPSEQESHEPAGAAEGGQEHVDPVGGTRVGTDTGAPEIGVSVSDETGQSRPDSALEAKDEEIARLKAENEQLRADKSSASDQRIATLEAENAGSKQQIANLKAENAESKQQIADSRHQLADLAARMERLEQRPPTSSLAPDSGSQTPEHTKASPEVLDQQGAKSPGLAERKDSPQEADAGDLRRHGLRRVISLENISALGTLSSASGTVADFAMHETSLAIPGLLGTGLGVGAMAAERIMKWRKRRHDDSN